MTCFSASTPVLAGWNTDAAGMATTASTDMTASTAYAVVAGEQRRADLVAAACGVAATVLLLTERQWKRTRDGNGQRVVTRRRKPYDERRERVN